VPVPDTPESGKAAFEALKGLSFDDAITKIANSLVDFSFKLLIAILVFYVGRFVIRKIYNLIGTVMINRHVDKSLTTFVLSLVRMVLYFILIVTIVGILGLETSSFLALFASAGVAIGMALSGTLQNFAGGVLILLLKPYRVGDYIEAQGFAGTVSEIQIFHTVINTADNKRIIIPNGGLSTGSINNYSSEQYRRVDWTVALSYDTDYAAAAEAIKRILLADDRVVEKFVEDDMEKRLNAGHEVPTAEEEETDHNDSEHHDAAQNDDNRSWWQRTFHRRKKHHQVIAGKVKQRVGLGEVNLPRADRSPFVGLAELADSSINLTVRAWTHSSNYWGLFFDMNARFYAELPKQGFSFPFPQLDVHLDQPCQQK